MLKGSCRAQALHAEWEDIRRQEVQEATDHKDAHIQQLMTQHAQVRRTVGLIVL